MALAACSPGETNGIPEGFHPPVAEPVPPPPPPPELKPVVILSYARVGGDEAAGLLAGDAYALRFLAMRQLAEARIVPVEDAEIRINANKGALLPMTAPPPSTGLDRPIPPIAQIVETAKRMVPGSSGMALVLESVLPAEPKARMTLYPQTKDAARKVVERLERLEATGLISPDERAAEAEALFVLINSDRLAETDLPPPPPPLPPEPKKHGKGTGGGHRGSVPMYVPDPTNFEAPKLDPKSTGQAGLYLMRVPDPSQADKAWTMLKTQSPELAKLGVVLDRTDLGDVGVTWRVVAGPVSVQEARSLCEAVRQKNQDCTPVPYPKNGTPPPPPKVAPPPAAAPAAKTEVPSPQASEHAPETPASSPAAEK